MKVNAAARVCALLQAKQMADAKIATRLVIYVGFPFLHLLHEFTLDNAGIREEIGMYPRVL